jgi:replication-associated recombination protein RarA
MHNKLMKELGYGENYQYAHNPRTILPITGCMPETLRIQNYTILEQCSRENHIKRDFSKTLEINYDLLKK